MPDAPNAPSSSRLADDLRRIREDRGVTLDALHEETKIPLGLLQQFEETGLFDHPMFNRVYLRSLVRAYADTVGISTEQALAALDEALTGAYQGRLAVTYLGEAPPVEAPPPADEAGDGEEEAAAAPPEAPAADVKPPAPAPPPVTPTPPPPQAVVPEPTAPAAAAPSWEAQSPPPPTRRVRPVDIRERTWNRQWIFIGVAVIVLAGAIWGVLSLVKQSAPEGAENDVAAVDTGAVDTTAALPPPAHSPVVLGDTIHFVVIATRKVERIRITRDDDLRRPYWIEQGDARAFPALQNIILEDRLDRIRLLVEGYDYPLDRRDEQGRLVVTRDDARAFLDAVSGPPVDLRATLEALRRPPPPSP